MAGQLVTLDGADGILTLTLRRPAALNALTTEMSQAVLDALSRVDRDPASRALIVTGEGRAFSAGADLKEREGATPQAIWAHTRIIFQLALELERLAAPVA